MERQWETYTAWAKEYDSDILHVEILGQSMIILNTRDACTDLLDKRSARYSGRTSLPMLTDLMGWSHALPFLPYGDKWRKSRRFIDEYINRPIGRERIFTTRSSCVHAFLRHMLNAKPDGLEDSARLLVGRIIIDMAYGFAPESENDPFIALSEAVAKAVLNAITPGRYLVNMIPALKYVPVWLPGARFKRDALRWRDQNNIMIEESYARVKEQIVSDSAAPSLVSVMLSKIWSSTEETLLKHTAGILYIAGIDTSTASLVHFFRIMLDHPAIHKAILECTQNLFVQNS
ncbi:cytochrome P450 [Schizophyllum commune H4-8]|uniref:cytochrome P450 n=1 Tax=Schizophyllum commune (strain H4-8 / FGSC 9210) TaxID=578458 RepID=UPI00215E3485|nr:cytochrome P450 [Schizophyllum commune H4-8]KAI5888178.1 cytochrome P450 [Schizophyllum commune H4-8]